MKNKTILITLAVLMLSACSLLGPQVQVSNVADSIEQVTMRHDQYVKADESLTDVQKLQFLGESTQLWTIGVMQKEVLRDEFAALVGPVTERHDEYVKSLNYLQVVERNIYLRSSRLLRMVAGLED